MQAWIAVSSGENYVLVTPEYWCFSKRADKDDLVFVYLTSKCSIAGIRHICRIDQLLEPHDECLKRKMVTRKLEKILTIDNPVSYQDLTRHPILKEMDGVTGRFQKTTIKITRSFILDELFNLIAEKNPSLQSKIQEMTKTMQCA